MADGLTPDTAPEPVYRSPWQRWVGFWFPASDPTTLGFIRLTTGLLVLYIHLAYSVDLQQFFGKTAWYAHRFVERERHEYPWQVTPFLDWDPQSIISAKLPEVPHRRKAVVDFIHNLPAEEVQRKDSLRFLDRLAKAENPDAPVITLYWFRKMGQSEEERERFLQVLIAGRPAADPPRETAYYVKETPIGLFALPQNERELLASEVRSFWTILPKNSTDRGYVLEHLSEVPHEVRKSFAEFLLTLPADKVEREKKIEYLEYWNNEPERSLRTGHAIFSVWFHVTDPTWMAILHVGMLLIIVLFTLGLFTRVTSVLAWLVVVSYIHRTQQVLFGMDTMMTILMFYLMIGNSGAALSLDRLIARYRAVRASLGRSGTIDAPTQAFLASPPPSVGAGFGLRLIQIHFCIIYVAAGLSKLKGAQWWNGQATWDVFVNPEFTLMQYEWYENVMRAIVSIKPVYHAMIIGGSWFTLFIEIAGPFLMWTRLRWLIVFLASLMHAIIAVMMGLNLFELLMIIMILAFMPDGVIRDRLRGAASAIKSTFTFNLANPRHTRAAAAAVALDVDNQLVLAPDKSANAPTISGPDRPAASGREGFERFSKELRVASTLSSARRFLSIAAIAVIALAGVAFLILGLDMFLRSALDSTALENLANRLRTSVGGPGLALMIVGGAVTLLLLTTTQALLTRLLFPTPPSAAPPPATAPKPPTPAATS